MSEEIEGVQTEMFEELDVQSEIAPEVISEAERFGWVPKERFRGSEADWVDAETFVKRGREINPILKANNERLKREIEDLRKQVEETSLSAKEFKKFQQASVERQVQDYQEQITALKRAKAEAHSDGDGDKVVQIEDQIDEIKEAQKQAKEIKEEVPVKVEAKPDPDFVAWKRENDWYMKDKRLTAIADSIGDELRSENPNLVGRDFLDEVVARVKEEMPHKFGNTSRERPIAVESAGGSKQVGSKKAKTYDNLPADAKTACDSFVRKGWLTKEEYISKYDWN